MRREHEQIEMALDDALNASDVQGVIEAVHDVIELSRSHFAKEENVLFPMAEQFVPAATLTELCQAWAKRREVAVTI
jgi:hemerythrin-like domain-containing protein